MRKSRLISRPARPLSDSHWKTVAVLVKAALATGVALCLALTVIFVARIGGQQSSVAAAGSTLPDPALVDASGVEGIFRQSLIDPRLILSQEMPVIYGVDVQEISLEDSTPPDNPETDIYFDVLPEDIKMEFLGFANDEPQEFRVGILGPQILIYHTHTTEAYRPTIEDEYVAAGSWRTKDNAHSVVAVGEILSQELQRYGFKVLHDTTNHEPPKLDTAYERSLVTMQEYQQKYPTIQVFIDLHRDAYQDVEAGRKDFVMVNGEECARVMCVVGTGEKCSVKPNYESNYKLALSFTNEMEKIKKGFTRPIRIKTGRYNQQVSDMCLLIEVGHNANTLQQAKNAAKYVALALSRVLEIGE